MSKLPVHAGLAGHLVPLNVAAAFVEDELFEPVERARALVLLVLAVAEVEERRKAANAWCRRAMRGGVEGEGGTSHNSRAMREFYVGGWQRTRGCSVVFGFGIRHPDPLPTMHWHGCYGGAWRCLQGACSADGKGVGAKGRRCIPKRLQASWPPPVQSTFAMFATVLTSSERSSQVYRKERPAGGQAPQQTYCLGCSRKSGDFCGRR